MSIFVVLLLALAVYYAGLIGLFAVGFRRVQRQPRPAQPTTEAPFVSVVVPARNEERHIAACLTSLLNSDYPDDAFEIIVVDDGSQDATAHIVRQMQQRTRLALAGLDDDVEIDDTSPLRLIKRPDTPDAHKRDALADGLGAARGDLLLTTDADCTVTPRWLSTMVASFTSDTAFVAGPVAIRHDDSWFTRLQALDLTGLVAVGAGAIGLGHPTICNSANVAFRRDVYEALLQEPPSARANPADDEVLLQRIARETPYQVRFCADPDALVTTHPVDSLGAFLRQRQRWASAGARYPGLGLVAMSAGIFAFYLTLLLGIVGLLFAPGLWPIVALALGLKMAAEASIVIPACRHLKQGALLRLFVPAQLLQLLYIVYSGATGALGRVRWKGRRVTR